MKIHSKGLPISRIFTASVIALALASPSAFANQAKHVTVAPENMKDQKLSNPNSKGLFSHSTMLPINSADASQKSLNATTSIQQIDQTIYFDGKENTPLIFIGPNTEQWQMIVIDPTGKELLNEAKNAKTRLSIDSISMGQESFKGKQFMMPKAAAGQFKISLSRQQSNSTTQIRTNNKPEGFLMFKGDPSYKLYSYLDNNLTVQNSDINIVAYMVDAKSDRGNRQKMVAKSPLQASVNQAFATITSPSKKQMTVPLTDDGLNGDKLAGDGLYSAKVPTSEVGVYTSQVQVQGVRPDGVRFSRTTTDLYPVEKAAYQFTKSAASLKLVNDTSALVSVPVELLGKSQPIYLAAEVWGTNKRGKTQSAAWIGGVVSPNQSSTLELSFDTRWLTRAKLSAPYSLKSLRMQTVDTNVPIAQQSSLSLKAPTLLVAESSKNSVGILSQDPLKITNDMLMGNAPISSGVTVQATANPKLLLVHGYCSGKVWNTANFSNSAEFQDYNQNRSHEAFAQRVITFGAPYTSYGIVAHSQGGAAALHMYTRYWTGLDYATGGRIIQSVGTPYRGTALAGNLAVIGDVFGIGCGTNTDLTYSGAANWLATIPSWARSEVDYYTTSFTDKWWRYDYCHLGTDLFLDDPEDGTTEKWAGQLSGGANKGHKTGWCHTTGMRDTAQYYDSSRNSSMNSRAAR